MNSGHGSSEGAPARAKKISQSSSISIDESLHRATTERQVPGVVAMATTGTDTLYQGAFGLRDLSGSVPMSLDTVFLMASMTKAVTSVAALQLVETGKLTLDGPLGDLMPQFAEPMVLEGFSADGSPSLRPATQPITLRRLLTHTSGFGHELWSANLVRYQEVTDTPNLGSGLTAALRVPLMFDPGERWEYSIGLELTGQVIEAATGMTLGAYLKENITGPLGMQDTGFGIAPSHDGRLATVHQRDLDGKLRPIEFEISTGEYEAGGGGLYGTAGDYLTFLRMLLNQGWHGERQILKPETVDLLGQNHIGDLEVLPMISGFPELTNDFDLYPGTSKKWGLAAMMTVEKGPNGRSAGSQTWGGLANCYFWFDQTSKIAGVFMTQILPFGDPGALNLQGSFERQIYEAAQ